MVMIIMGLMMWNIELIKSIFFMMILIGSWFSIWLIGVKVLLLVSVFCCLRVWIEFLMLEVGGGFMKGNLWMWFMLRVIICRMMEFSGISCILGVVYCEKVW